MFIDNILYECVLYLKLLILIKKEKKTMYQVILFENIFKKIACRKFLTSIALGNSIFFLISIYFDI